MSAPLIVGLSGPNGSASLAQRITTLEDNESYYQIFELVGTATSGSVTIPTEASLYDVFGDGVLDAIVVEADSNNVPTDVESTEVGGAVVEVTSLDGGGNYVLSGTPSKPACLLYFIKIKDKFKSNIPEVSIVSPGIPLNQEPFGVVTVAKSNSDFTSIKEACDHVATLVSSSTPYVIKVTGAFIEAPFVVPEFTILSMESASVAPSDPNNTMVTMSGTSSEILGGVFAGPANSDAILITAINTVLTRVVISGADVCGVRIQGVGLSGRALLRNVTISGGIDGVCIDGSRAIITTSSAVGCTGTAISVNNNSVVAIDSFGAFSCMQDFAIIDNLSQATMNASQIDIDKISIANYDNVQLSFQSSKEGDRASENAQEVHIGLPEKGQEFSSGEGESYTRGMLVYTETDLGAFADVSEAARSASGSTFTYPGTTTNNAIYITSSLSNGSDFLYHAGIKTSVLTPAIFGTGEIVLEYWNGSSWTEINGSDRQGVTPYFNRNKNYFTVAESAQLRYDINLAIDSWSKNDPMGIGVSYYWARFRIASNITTAPIFEQFKLHPNKFELNSDAFREYFGTARSLGQLPINIGQAKPIAGNMQNQTLWIDENVGVGLQTNRFTATGDILGWNFLLPFDADTSSPVVFVWGGLPSQAAVIQWTVRISHIEALVDSLYASNPAPGSNPNTKTVIVNGGLTTLDVANTYTAKLDVSDAVERRLSKPGDLVFITLQPTILSGTFSLVGAGASYTKWSDGGHI